MIAVKFKRNHPPFLCWVFTLQHLYTDTKYQSVIDDLKDWYNPDDEYSAEWFPNIHISEEESETRLTAFYLFEQIALSEKLYLNWSIPL